jgi:hypothetical protein
MAYWTYPLALYGYVKGVRSAVQHGNVIASIRQYQALRHGAWFYSILSATKASGDPNPNLLDLGSGVSGLSWADVV